MSNNNSKDFLSDDGWVMKTVKIAQIILIGLCVVVFIGLLCFYGIKTVISVDPVRMELCLSVDTTGTVSPQAKQLADSLIYEIKKQETILEDKYQYFIEQQSNTQDLLAVGSVLLGIIVSLIGFYGISTMKSIEDKARKVGEESAKEAFAKRLSELQNRKYKELLEEKFKPEVAKQIQESLNRFEGQKTSSIDNHDRRIILLEESVSNISKKLKNSGENDLRAVEAPNEPIAIQEPDVFNPQNE